jgi:hypothetical protein
VLINFVLPEIDKNPEIIEVFITTPINNIKMVGIKENVPTSPPK